MKEKDYKLILKKMEQYINIQNLFKKINPKKIQVAKDIYNFGLNDEDLELQGILTLFGVLKYNNINDFHNILLQLDRFLEIYPIYNNKRIAYKLQESFFDTFSEIQIYDRLIIKNKGTVCIDPRISPNEEKNLDFKIHPFHQDIYIEVITPKPSKLFEERVNSSYAGCLEPSNRIISKVQEEIKKHFADKESIFSFPLIIIVNCKYLWFGEYGDITLNEKENSIISGVLCYNLSSPYDYSALILNKSTSFNYDEIDFFRTLFNN